MRKKKYAILVFNEKMKPKGCRKRMTINTIAKAVAVLRYLGIKQNYAILGKLVDASCRGVNSRILPMTLLFNGFISDFTAEHERILKDPFAPFDVNDPNFMGNLERLLKRIFGPFTARGISIRPQVSASKFFPTFEVDIFVAFGKRYETEYNDIYEVLRKNSNVAKTTTSTAFIR